MGKGRPRKTTDAQNIAIKRLRDAGNSMENIANAVDISVSTAYTNSIRGELELSKAANRQLQVENMILRHNAASQRSKRTSKA